MEEIKSIERKKEGRGGDEFVDSWSCSILPVCCPCIAEVVLWNLLFAVTPIVFHGVHFVPFPLCRLPEKTIEGAQVTVVHPKPTVENLQGEWVLCVCLFVFFYAN